MLRKKKRKGNIHLWVPFCLNIQRGKEKAGRGAGENHRGWVKSGGGGRESL